MVLALLACRTDAPAKDTDTPEDSPPSESAAVPPTLSSIEPGLGDTLGGVVVTVRGEALAGVGSVTIGGAPCGELLPVDDGTLTCVAPALAAGVWDVAVDTGSTLVGAWEAWSPTEIPDARVYTASAGVTLEAPLGPLWMWTQQAATAPWHPRDGAGLLWFADKLWLLGGWDGAPVAEWNNQQTTNEVWSSDDLGATWTLELADDPDPPTTGADARWLPRHTAGWLVHEVDGTPYLYVVGGDIYHVTSDVWRSADGTTWEEMTADAPWGGRVLQMVGSYAGDLYVMGGQIEIYDPGTTLQDVWKSSDGGATWERLDDAPWAPRGMTYNPVEHDGRLWLVGGGTYDDEPRTYYNDVWSFDGTTWTEVLPDGEAPWIGREYHNTFAAEGQLWVSSGFAADGANHNDVWHSVDGASWTEATGVPFAPGHADGITASPYGVIHASGNAMDTAVYRMVAHEGAPMSAWADQGGGGLDLGAPSEEARPVFVADGFGTAEGVWLDGVDSFLQLDAWDALPAGHSVFWVGRTKKDSVWSDYVNPAMTVVGDSNGACRAQAGYSADQIELVVTDALGAWSEGHVLRGSGQNDDQVRLVGFTHAVDGTVVAYIDGAQAGEVAVTTYDATWMGWDLVGAGYSTGSRAQVMLGAVVVIPAVIGAEDLEKLTVWADRWRQSTSTAH